MKSTDYVSPLLYNFFSPPGTFFLLRSALLTILPSIYVSTDAGERLFCTLPTIQKTSLFFLVLILSVRGVLVRKFMLAAYSLGMTRGDWTFLDVEIFQVENNHKFSL
jgi:hypothetical protein